MSDTVQPGTKVDKELWDRFREDVKRRKGGTRGHLRTELENALRNYIQTGEATPADIDARLQRIEAAVGAASTDGGVDTFGAETHTHAPNEELTEKPPANTATEKKVAWLAKCVREKNGGELQEVSRNDLIKVVKEEYGFRSDTAKRYVERLVEYFELVTHPATDEVLVTEERYEYHMEQRRKDAREEASEEL